MPVFFDDPRHEHDLPRIAATLAVALERVTRELREWYETNTPCGDLEAPDEALVASYEALEPGLAAIVSAGEDEEARELSRELLAGMNNNYFGQ